MLRFPSKSKQLIKRTSNKRQFAPHEWGKPRYKAIRIVHYPKQKTRYLLFAMTDPKRL